MSKSRSGSRSSSSKSSSEESIKIESVDDIFEHVPIDIASKIASKMIKKTGEEPIFNKENKERAIKIIKKTKFLPTYWNLDHHLYPLLQEKIIVKEDLDIERAKQFGAIRTNHEGEESLVKAAQEGDINSVGGLLQAGVNINCIYRGKDSYRDYKYTPLLKAVKYGKHECVKFLLTFPNIDINLSGDLLHLTPLHMAIEKDCFQCFKLLIEDPRININVTNDTYNTPFHTAASYGRENYLKLLLQKPGNNIDIQAINGTTPLHEAASQGKDTCVKLLLEEGANVNIQERNGYTPLILAIRLDIDTNKVIINFLLTQKIRTVDVNIQDNMGRTALHWACLSTRFSNDMDIIKKLLNNPNTNINIEDNKGKKAFDYISFRNLKTEKEKEEIKDLFKKKEQELAVSSSAASSSTIPPSTGGKPKLKASKDCVTYAGRKYVVRIGSKGGKYILVGTEKKKVYI